MTCLFLVSFVVGVCLCCSCAFSFSLFGFLPSGADFKIPVVPSVEITVILWCSFFSFLNVSLCYWHCFSVMFVHVDCVIL